LLEENEYGIENDGQFADYINGKYYDGKNVIDPPNQVDTGCLSFNYFNDKDEHLFGRNLDLINQDIPSLITLSKPLNGFKNISASTFYCLMDIDNINDEFIGKTYPILSLCPMDGMNEKGVVIEINSVNTGSPHIPTNQSGDGKINLTNIIYFKYVLEHARNVDDALLFLEKFNLHDNFQALSTFLPFHFQVADSSGNSAIIEFDSVW
jgi:penicillin V acylase-like amidase (Ntn superfamily)